MTYHNIPYQKFWFSLPLALVTACGPADRAWRFVEPGWTASTQQLSLGPTAIEARTSASFELAHAGDGPRVATLVLSDSSGAFALVGTEQVEVPAADALTVELSFQPSGPGPSSASLAVEDALGQWSTIEVSLTGLVQPDGDGDGHAHELAGGADCDDQDPAIHPDATELWYDGVDQDCDGRDDDQDGDGAPLASDCDDTDAERSPDATELWYDGVDQDCDGQDDDQDGDGFLLAADCDDTDAGRYPGAVDPADGIDQDCDGITDEDDATTGSAVVSELFPEISSKTGAYDLFLELYLRVPIGLSGWTLQVGDDVSVLEDRRTGLGEWVLLCSEGLAAVFAECGVVVEPWPALSQSEDEILLRVDGREISRLRWDSSWELYRRSLQADRARLVGGADASSLADWCEATATPGTENQDCPD